MSWLESGIEQVPPSSFQPRQGTVVWLTGLSGAGKSTIASAAAAALARHGIPVEILDGDLLRKSLSKDLGFSKADRDENVARAGFVANLLSLQGVIVLVALVSPYAEARNTVRARVRRFIEVYVNAPLTVCERRDPKGLYRLARRGELPAFTGVSDPYQPPAAPEVECHTDRESLEESVGKVLAAVYGVPEQRVPLTKPKPGIAAGGFVQCVRS